MTATLIPIRTEREAFRETVVTVLENLLAEARAGHVQAVACAFVRPDGAINAVNSEGDDVGRLLGATELLRYRMLKSIEP